MAADRRQLYKYKGDRCAYCGLTVDEMMARYGTFHRMFQLNHVDPNKKDKHYRNIIRCELSENQLDEVDKCILLCNECHGIVHAQNIAATVKLTVRIKRRRAVQTLKGQFIIDRVDNTATFFTDEPILLCSYWVRVGNKKPRMVFGTELRPVMEKELRRLDRTRKMAVYGSNGKALMSAKWTPDGIEVQHLIRCPFVTGELLGEDGNAGDVWVRNGVLLTKDGEVHRRGVMTYRGCKIDE
jgi:hypothetical protein